MTARRAVGVITWAVAATAAASEPPPLPADAGTVPETAAPAADAPPPRYAAVEAAPPGVPGPKGLGFDFRRRGHVGVGVVAGTWTNGVSLRAVVSRRDAIQASFGASATPFAYWPVSGAGFAVDWLHLAPVLWEARPLRLAWSIGVGLDARLATRRGQVNADLGVHAVGGLELLFKDAPVDLALEYRPGVVIAVTDVNGLAFAYGDLALHVRWWF